MPVKKGMLSVGKQEEKVHSDDEEVESVEEDAVSDVDDEDEEPEEDSDDQNEEEIEEDDDEDGFDDMEDIPIDSNEAKHMNLKSNRKRVFHEDTAELQAKPSKLSKAYLLKPPTNQEINNLRETENLFHSNLLRLQIDEMLGEIRLKEKHQKSINKWIGEFSSAVKCIPTSDSYPVSDLKWLNKFSVKSPFTMKQKDPKAFFRYVKPEEIKPVGSYPLGFAGSPNTVVDILVQMPRDCFKHGDHLNYRYHCKRALYLAYIAAHLKDKAELVADLSYGVHMGDTSRPSLLITPAGKLGKHCTFRILPAPPPAFAPPKKLLPGKNAVRVDWWNGKSGKTEEEEDAGMKATPHYNAGVLIDMSIAETERLRHEVLSPLKNVVDACHLLRVWLKQRGLQQGYSGFSLFILTSYVLHLVQTRKISAHMSSYQVFRTVLLHIARSDWTKEAVTLGTPVDVDDFFQHYEVVMINSSSEFNICAQLSRETYNWVRWEAGVAVACLNRGFPTSFDSLFMIRKPFITSFDNVLRISDFSHVDASDEALDFAGFSAPAALKKIAAVLYQGLGNRIKLLGVRGFKEPTCPINGVFPADKELVFGLLLNPVEAWSTLMKGPLADQPEAAEFRSFWGEKSQLRRFQDGTVCEAVYFPVHNLKEKRLITQSIVSYLLQKNFRLNESQVTYIADQLDSILDVPRLNKETHYGTGEEFNQKAIQALDALSKNLRKLEDLPLSITQVQGISAALRHTDVFPPLPQLPQGNQKSMSRKGNFLLPSAEVTPKYFPSLKVLLTLETSGKWPDDHEAIRRIKAAFYLKLSEELHKLNLVTRVFATHVDVVQNNYAFQLTIAYQRDAAFLKRVVEDGIVKYRDNKESLELERETVVLPKLSGALRGLQADQPAFSATVRLAKRWIASHMLLDYFPETAVEIIVASLFIDAGAYATPGDLVKLTILPGDLNGPANPLTGFLRFLQLMANRDWKNLPLVANFNEELTGEEIAAIETEISSKRAQLPTVLLVTPFDKTGCAFTRYAPTPAALARIMILAGESFKVLEKMLMEDCGKSQMDVRQVFRPPLEPFDVVIQLRRNAVAKRLFALDEKPSKHEEKLFDKDRKTLPVLDFEPVRLYLDELRQSYGDKARFFYDDLGGFLIGVMWIDRAWQPSDFKVSHVNGCSVDSSASELKLVPNLEAICQDFLALGQGLVSSVQTKTFEWKGHL